MLSFTYQKRILDVVTALTLIVLFLPIWIIVPFLIFVESGLPIFFTHRRVGRGGREFDLLKFRSMVKGADELLHNHDNKLCCKQKKLSLFNLNLLGSKLIFKLSYLTQSNTWCVLKNNTI